MKSNIPLLPLKKIGIIKGKWQKPKPIEPIMNNKNFKTFFNESLLLEVRKRIITKGVPPEGFKEYMRSEQEVRNTIRKSFNKPVTIETVLKIYAMENKLVDDSVFLKFPAKTLWKYREHDRNIFVDRGKYEWNGMNTREYYNELKLDIMKNGIKEKLWMMVGRKKNGDVESYLGEGNHRLAIAMELDEKMEMPVYFRYYRAM